MDMKCLFPASVRANDIPGASLLRLSLMSSPAKPDNVLALSVYHSL